MKEKPQYYPETRRLLIKFGLLALVRTLFISWVNESGSEARTEEIRAAIIRQQRAIVLAAEHGETLQVWQFSSDIVDAAVDLAKYHALVVRVSAPVGWFTGDSILGYLLEKQSEMVNRGAGVSAMLLGRSIDLLSTYHVGTVFADPRMREYQLDTYFGEANEILPRNYTAEDVLEKAPILLLPPLAISAFFPSLGRGYLGASPAVAKNNYTIAKAAVIAMSIGDEVKRSIQLGKDTQFIKQQIIYFGNTDDTLHN